MEILDAKLDKDDVQRVYGRLAPVYDFWAYLTEGAARRRCIELSEVRDGESVLEVAVGTGVVFAELVKANRSGKNEGIDLTEAMLEQARRRLARLGIRAYRLQRGDASALPFADGSFDLVVNNYMFDLLPEADFAPVLAEMRRVLRPGGRVVIVNMTNARTLLARLAEAVYRIHPEWMGGCRGVRMDRPVREAGFERVERHVVTQLGIPSEVLRAYKPV
jgi:ubiquinone/menaquinone biosynthesis C-methylase UbiE